MVGSGEHSTDIVCTCRLVTEETVVAAVEASGGSLLELMRRSDAGTRCGACLPAVWALLTAEAGRSGTPP
ncbi:MAG TPA: (2Fe-2S)-binding protein [Acidimicrobiales bacterium]